MTLRAISARPCPYQPLIELIIILANIPPGSAVRALPAEVGTVLIPQPELALVQPHLLAGAYTHPYLSST